MLPGGARKFGAENSDDEDEVVRIHKPKRLANVDAIRSTLKEMIVTEKKPFFVDEVVLLELFRKTCFCFNNTAVVYGQDASVHDGSMGREVWVR